MYMGCEEIKEHDERWQCASKELLQAIYQELTYPAEARKDSIEGKVYLAILIDRHGHAYDVQVRNHPLGYGLEEEAKRAARVISYDQWCPAVVRCNPVDSEYRLSVRFDLR